MVKIGSKNNLIKQTMALLGDVIPEYSIDSAMNLLKEIKEYPFEKMFLYSFAMMS